MNSSESAGRQRIEKVQMAWRRFSKNKLSLVCLIIIILLVFVAIFASWVAPYSIINTNAGQPLSPPSAKNLFGTDDSGRDILSLVVMGSRVSLSVGISAAVASTLFGALIGSIAGYYGGPLDEVLMRFTELIMVIPTFILAVVFLAFFGTSFVNTVFIISAGLWPGAARTIRAEFMRLKEMEFVESARAVGAGNRHIILREILPNAYGVLIVNVTVVVGFAIVVEAGLSFVGLSNPNLPDWGLLLNRAMTYMFRAWWMAFFPGITITATSLVFNLLGDGLSQVLNPKSMS